jgi:hypothetical protein
VPGSRLGWHEHDLGAGDGRVPVALFRGRVAAPAGCQHHGGDVFTSAGLLAGSVFGLLDISVGSAQVKLIAEITLTLVLFADARGFRCARCAASTRCRCGCLALACH